MISRRRAPVAPVRARRVVLSLPLLLSFPPSPSPFCLAYVSPLSGRRLPRILHSAASLIVHARLDARNGVARSAINGTLRLSIGRPLVDEFIRSWVLRSRRTGRYQWSKSAGPARLVCMCMCNVRAEASAAIVTEIPAGPRESQSVCGNGLKL